MADVWEDEPDTKNLAHGLYWLGFDCAHSGDLSPKCRHFSCLSVDEYRDLTYVTAEVESLASQLAGCADAYEEERRCAP